MSKHSPEPWTAHRGFHGSFIIRDSLNRLIAETNNTSGTHDRRLGSPSTPQAAEANAHLLAQAPTLQAFARLVSDFSSDDSAGHMRYLKEQADIALGEPA